MLELLDRYIEDVQSGVIPTGRLVGLAVRRHVRDLEIGHTRGLTFDRDLVAAKLPYFGHLTLTTGEFNGQPMRLRGWQVFCAASLFGWRRSDGTRRFRDALISVARGNGKSPFGASLGLYFTFLDDEARAEGYCFATKQDQAKVVFEEARRFVERSSLNRVLDCRVASIVNPKDYSTLRPLGSDSKNTDALVPHVIILDEVHEFRQQHRGLVDKVDTAMGKRRQPLLLRITTRGGDYSEILRELDDYSVKILEQVITEPEMWAGDDHFSFIAALDKEDDVFDESNWPKANPMLLEPDSPVKIAHLRSMAAKAKAGDIFAENKFRRYHCNQWSSGVEKPITPELWARGDVSLAELDGLTATFGGIDLSRSNDWCAVTLVTPVESGDDSGPRYFELRTWAWTVERPGEGIASSLDVMSLRRTAENLFVLPGSQIEFGIVRDFILQLAEDVLVLAWSYDDSFARETAQILAEGHGLPMVACPQTAAAYNEPIVRFMQELRAGRIRHGGCPLLRWQALNLALRENARGLYMPDKSQKQYKIDSMVAMLMAFREAITTAASVSSYYDEHEIEAG